MVDQLITLPAFPAPSIERADQVRIVARENVQIVGITARERETESLVLAFRAVYGLDLPMKPARVEKDGLAVVWAGWHQWLLMSDVAAVPDLEQIMRADFGGYAAVVDHSDARAIVAVSGRRARDLLAKGVSIDLHPRVFTTGDAAATAISHVGMHIWQTDEKPTFELAVPRTYADSLWRWMERASAEYQNSDSLL
ncbi:N-methylglutamate dehydrogenase subunit D [Filomicrobium insigne]|uniref:N-methylglutamate dehydrogenase subunit D n=1 Tax=Filomicrobium insigne TaxID=418854 RepID=A0A1H0J1K2_9HYPH|nr:sarcosine oxidase subunit gamma family protein [Filomicrobium insigne]SDO37423.1 N-methylglutamate dehydrogenase subunit D [Filomicrobium insigne]